MPGNESMARAAELGIHLDEEACDALASIPLNEAFSLLDCVASKGVGKGVRNPSGYIKSAIGRMGEEPPWRQPAKGDGGRRGVPGAGGKSWASSWAAFAEELGLELDQAALDALASVPLREALDLVESVAAKGVGSGRGEVRNPSSYISTSVQKLHNAGAGVEHGVVEREVVARPRRANSTEARVLELNGLGLWGGEKIDVEALFALKALPLAEAQGLLDTLEAKGSGKGGVNVRNPSKYILAAISKGDGGSASATRKRSRPESSAPVGSAPATDKRIGLWRGAAATRQSSADAAEAAEAESRGAAKRPRRSAGGRSEQRAADLGIDLCAEAKEALATVRLSEAYHILDKVASERDHIKNVSAYIISAVRRGIRTAHANGDGDDTVPARRARPSSAPVAEERNEDNLEEMEENQDNLEEMEEMGTLDV